MNKRDVVGLFVFFCMYQLVAEYYHWPRLDLHKTGLFLWALLAPFLTKYGFPAVW